MVRCTATAFSRFGALVGGLVSPSLVSPVGLVDNHSPRVASSPVVSLVWALDQFYQDKWDNWALERPSHSP